MKNDNNYKLYVLTFPDGKKYVGITTQHVNERWANGNGYKTQKNVYEQILTYGWDNIDHDVLYYDLSQNEAIVKEQELIAHYSDTCGVYNITKGGEVGGLECCTFEYNGKIYTSKELAEISKEGITYHDITTRINNHKWDIDKAISSPKISKNIKFDYMGNKYTIKELYDLRKDKNLTVVQIRNRLLKHGWDVERAITQSNKTKNQPKGVGTCLFEYNGKTYNSWELCQISDVEGLLPQDITDRINRRGWSVERAITQPKRKR